MNLNITPDPLVCARNPGGVNSVVADHALGFLAAGCGISNTGDVHIVHALAQDRDIDIFHCHGLYPIGEGYFSEAYNKANHTILQNALQAKLTICISEFSANLLRHKLHIDPLVTRNGIWTKDYPRGGSASGAVLFPKIALDANAKADDLLWLKKHTDLNLLSVAHVPGVRSTGHLSRADFLKTLRSCAIYLGTTKENNSMATMEAMISGVPVVGYNIGFNSEWLMSGNGCELVPNGDQLALQESIAQVLGNWQRYSQAAREYAHIFDWQPVIDELLRTYEQVNHTPESQTVSIVIPCHNYARYLDEAIQSALKQTLLCEVMVIDDASTDESVQIAKQYKKVKLLQNKVNLGVAETRNKAIRQAHGEFIICLDADDRLLPDFAEKHLRAFRNRQDAITYAPITLIDQYGNAQTKRMFHAQAVPGLQAQGRNQIPSACMFRKEFWQRAGGYEKQYTPAEDAQLWLKIFQLGGTAHQASASPLMEYRTHEDSLSRQGFPDWWLGSHLDFNEPVRERDADITIVIEGNEGIRETLICLENQKYQKWTALLPQNPNGLAKSFPWLNKGVNRKANVLTVKAGTVLPVDYLTEYVSQTPPWMSASRLPSP